MRTFQKHRYTIEYNRLCVSEVLTIDDNIKPLILQNASETDIDRSATDHGMRTMYLDGMVKALRGETTVEEVLRVTREAG